jgi:uncharacterized protein (DUF433 family)
VAGAVFGIQPISPRLLGSTKSHRCFVSTHTGLGKPVIKGTRIPVELIIRKLGEGATIEELLDAYPNLTQKAVQDALLYAAESIQKEQLICLKTGTAEPA